MIRRMAGFLGIMLHRMPVERILRTDEKQCLYCNISPDELNDLVLTYAPEYGEADINMQIEEIRSQISENAFEITAPKQANRINVFSVLFYYIRDVLLFYENEVVCRYQNLLEWNELVRLIGQDLPISAFLACEDSVSRAERNDFYWKPVIGQNNVYLLRILKKGMAENHFHLRGSAPYFDVSWINLMNNPENETYMNMLRGLENNLRNKQRKSDIGTTKMSLPNLVRAAALIRLYFCFKMDPNLKSFAGKQDRTDNDNTAAGVAEDKEHVLKDSSQINIPFSILERKFGEIEYLLDPSKTRLEMEVDNLAHDIGMVRGDSVEPDYMLRYVSAPIRDKDREMWILAGERWFLYQVLRLIMAHDRLFTDYEYNLFYAYIRIKNELRAELIQNNEIAGFDNFQIYQKRKDLFSHHGNWEVAEGRLARLAVRDVLSDPAVKHLEVRITPNVSAEQIMKDIKGYDEAILRPFDSEEAFRHDLITLGTDSNCCCKKEEFANSKRESMKQRFHYVLHFTKRGDYQQEEAKFLECRHYGYRKKLERTGSAIIRCKTLYPAYANRIIGIDACSREIGCRPEVFGKVFRALRFYIPPEPNHYVGNQQKSRQLRFTYHVGEDFLDIADGLRAIDEAIRYLAMNCGDRLGHALALGVDPDKWYRDKGYRISLPIQDYLDNCVWLHHYLNKYGIENMSSVKGWMEEKFRQFFEYVYQPFIPFVRDLHRIEAFDKEDENHLTYAKDYFTQMSQNGFDMDTYYLAWLLRGDDPHLYVSGKFKKEPEYDYWSRYSINASHIKKQDIRMIPTVALLYSMYHYNNMVKDRGSEIRTFELHRDYPRAVAAVQREMRRDITRRGIGIETNPSSNYKIGAFKDFSHLPIKDLYNIDLTYDPEELEECAQMNVSINTDDMGVFNTRLENEYALVAAAMEAVNTPEGKPKYKRQNINRWLDNIREMGLRQSFDFDIRGEQDGEVY